MSKLGTHTAISIALFKVDPLVNYIEITVSVIVMKFPEKKLPVIAVVRISYMLLSSVRPSNHNLSFYIFVRETHDGSTNAADDS